ncbi:MAG: ArnT family glycosyltransferase [Gemmatimonas sp.]
MTSWVVDAPGPEAIPPATRRRDLIVIGLVSFVLYALNVDFWVYGDSALYADYSLRRSFTEVTLHYAYYWLVIGAQAVAGPLLGLPIEQTMSWLNVAFGSATLCIAYVLALELLGSRPTALITVAILGVSGRVLINSTSSEIYITQMFFVLLSFWAFLRERLWLASIGAALSMLISPLSMFAFLFYPVADYQRTGRIRWNVLIRLTLYSVALYLPYLVVYGHDLLYGPRGLLIINDITRPDPVASARNFPKYQFKQYTTMLVLFVPALFALRRNARFLVLSAAVALPHIFIILKLTGEDNVFIMNTDFFFAAILALGWTQLLSSRRTAWIGPAALAGHVALLVVSRAIFAFDSRSGYGDELRAVYNDHIRGQDATLITDWGTAAAFAFHTRDTASSSLWEEERYLQVWDLDNEPALDSPVRKAATLYVLDRWNPTPLNRLLSSEASLRQQREDHSVESDARRRLNISCTLLEQHTNRLYRCTRNAAPADGAAGTPASGR